MRLVDVQCAEEAGFEESKDFIHPLASSLGTLVHQASVRQKSRAIWSLRHIHSSLNGGRSSCATQDHSMFAMCRETSLATLP